MDDLSPFFVFAFLGGWVFALCLRHLLEAGAEFHRRKLRINAARKRSAWIVGKCRRIA